MEKHFPKIPKHATQILTQIQIIIPLFAISIIIIIDMFPTSNTVSNLLDNSTPNLSISASIKNTAPLKRKFDTAFTGHMI